MDFEPPCHIQELVWLAQNGAGMGKCPEEGLIHQATLGKLAGCEVNWVYTLPLGGQGPGGQHWDIAIRSITIAPWRPKVPGAVHLDCY